MATKIQAVRGMNDILPESTPCWQRLEQACAELAAAYGYEEVRFPIIESTGLFQRTIGQATDIVEKEMYTFADRNGDSLTLRPEGTAGCVRCGIENGLLYNQQQRLWYLGPMFRHERPQKGRYRQFHQFGVEAYGIAGPGVDAELILLSARLWQQLGLADQLELQINSLGSAAARAQYREILVDYFQQHQQQLDADSQRRLTSNPLRILDSKNPDMQDLIHAAPKLIDHLDEDSKKHFATLQQLLTQANIAYRINPHLVRGLDYYCSTVFEWVTGSLGAQGTVCAGGRYDSLVEELGGKATSAIGFAMGLERLVVLMQAQEKIRKLPHLYGVFVGEAALTAGLLLAEDLRSSLPLLRMLCNVDMGDFKKQLKRADKSGAKWALIMGEQELAAQKFSLKDLQSGEQQSFNQEGLINFLGEQLLQEE